MRKPEQRIQRGELLRMLYRMYPDAIGNNVIDQTFTWVTPGLLRSHVAYLVDSGYATREDIDHEKYKWSTADYILKVTPQGIDLLEGNIQPDPGILNPPL